MKSGTVLQIFTVFFYFTKNLVIICGVSAFLALGIASWLSFSRGFPWEQTFFFALGGLGVILMILGALLLASGPGLNISAVAAISRTHIRDIQATRTDVNPLFGVGLSLLMSGIILSTIAVSHV